MIVPIVIVAAVADNGVIGSGNRLVWRLRTDLKRFRLLTLGRPVVMGRKTFDSIGKPLPGRETIVVTRDPGFAPAGVHLAGSLDEALELGRQIALTLNADSIAVAGGGEIYAQALPRADRLEITHVHADPPGDVRFPAIDPALFSLAQAAPRQAAGPEDEHDFTFATYRRRG